MKTLASLGVLVLLVLGLPAAPGSAAPAATQTFDVTVSRTTVRSGQSFTASGASNAVCAWIMDWNNERRTATAKRITARFVAPVVEERTVVPLRGTCFYAPPGRVGPAQKSGKPAAGGSSTSQKVNVAVPQSLNETIDITVLPTGTVVEPPDPGGGGGGDLPDTGGPDLWILLAGLATLLVGASLIRLSSPDPLVDLSR